jgi:NADPH:quinone reductase-like Zn-dependent oxidoreductase
MKAVRFSQFGGPEVLEIVELPDPHPGPGQVRIAVRAAGVNPSDWKKRQGLMDEELPQTLGYEAAGVVDELGEGVVDVALGDRVFGLSEAGAAQAELAVLSTTRRSRRRSTSPRHPRCRPLSRRPRGRLTSSASPAAARCSSTARQEASAAPRSSSPWRGARV